MIEDYLDYICSCPDKIMEGMDFKYYGSGFDCFEYQRSGKLKSGSEAEEKCSDLNSVLVDVQNDYEFELLKEVIFDAESTGRRGAWFKQNGIYKCGRWQNGDSGPEWEEPADNGRFPLNFKIHLIAIFSQQITNYSKHRLAKVPPFERKATEKTGEGNLNLSEERRYTRTQYS